MNNPFLHEDDFFKSHSIRDGGQVLDLLKARTHKYIKRTGAPGSYKYWYKTATGKVVEGRKPAAELKQQHAGAVAGTFSEAMKVATVDMKEELHDRLKFRDEEKHDAIKMKWAADVLGQAREKKAKQEPSGEKKEAAGQAGKLPAAYKAAFDKVQKDKRWMGDGLSDPVVDKMMDAGLLKWRENNYGDAYGLKITKKGEKLVAGSAPSEKKEEGEKKKEAEYTYKDTGEKVTGRAAEINQKIDDLFTEKKRQIDEWNKGKDKWGQMDPEEFKNLLASQQQKMDKIDAAVGMAHKQLYEHNQSQKQKAGGSK